MKINSLEGFKMFAKSILFSFFRNKKASFKGIYTLNSVHMWVFIITESLNTIATHLKLQNQIRRQKWSWVKSNLRVKSVHKLSHPCQFKGRCMSPLRWNKTNGNWKIGDWRWLISHNSRLTQACLRRHTTSCRQLQTVVHVQLLQPVAN